MPSKCIFFKKYIETPLGIPLAIPIGGKEGKNDKQPEIDEKLSKFGDSGRSDAVVCQNLVPKFVTFDLEWKKVRFE